MESDNGVLDSFTPRDWDDDERMNFMFSAFPKERSANPKHWNSKLTYWTEEIKRCCKSYRDVCISCEKLRKRFRRNDTVPQGLNIVLLHMEREGMLTSQENLLRCFENGWFSWSYGVVKGSAKWLWSSVWKNDVTDEQKDYVVLPIVEEMGTELLNRHYKAAKFDKTDHVVPWNVVKSLYFPKKISDEDLLLIVAFLKSKKLADLGKNCHGEMLVKFAKNVESIVVPVNENDWHVIRLKKAIAKLKLESADIKNEVSRLQKTAQSCLKEKDRAQAKRVVFQKRKLEKSFNMKQDTLLTLTDQLQTIQNADSNKMILDAISSSAVMLNKSFQEEGLTHDTIDQVFDKNIEASEYSKEVDNSISEGLRQLGDDIDTEELENELAELLLETENEKDVSALEVLDLPKVPAHSPGISTSSGISNSKADTKKRIRTLAN